MHLLVLLLLAGCGDRDSDDALDLPVVASVRASDDSGLFAWIADEELLGAATGTNGQPAVLQWRSGDGSWTAVPGPAGQGAAADTRYFLPAAELSGDLAQVELRVSVAGQGGEGAAPVEIGLYADTTTPDPPLNSRDTVVVSVSTSLAPLEDRGGAIELQVDLAGADGTTTGWLDNHCRTGTALRDCLADSATPWIVPDLAGDLELPQVGAVHDHPARLSFTVRMYLDAVGTDGLPTRALLAEDDTEPLLSLGRKLYWGDLHAHSNLSHDGCEEWEEDCGVRGDYAAQDFFQNAREVGLDFVASTEHAEWGTFFQDGLGTTGVDIWEEQKRLATASDGSELVTLVGYEWTNFRTLQLPGSADYEGGHKTVIFEQLDIHEDFRIGAERDEEVVKKGDGSAYMAADNERTNDPVELRELLDAAKTVHGPTRVLTFFHHTALDVPQAVDWAQEFNWPDYEYEPVVEMYSEHGSSECFDVEAEYCDFGVQETVRRVPYGSVQYALSLGMQFGFVSGTDCHDARPGSIDDGPGWHGSPGGADSVILQQFAAGGLTGAWVAGSLDRVALFESIWERATLSSSGPRIISRLLGLDDQGRPYLPGATLPADARTLTLTGRVDGNGYSVDRVQLVDKTGAIVADSEGSVVNQTIELEAGGAWYVRLIMSGQPAVEDTGAGGGDTGEPARVPHRVWMSPFFTEAAE